MPYMAIYKMNNTILPEKKIPTILKIVGWINTVIGAYLFIGAILLMFIKTDKVNVSPVISVLGTALMMFISYHLFRLHPRTEGFLKNKIRRKKYITSYIVIGTSSILFPIYILVYDLYIGLFTLAAFALPIVYIVFTHKFTKKMRKNEV